LTFNKIKIKINFTSNFTPKINSKKSLKKNKIFLRSFFIFTFLLNKKKNSNFNFNFFIKPKKIKKFIFLRAPYRHKLARIHLAILRYTIFVIVNVTLNKVINIRLLKNNMIFFKKLPTFFESALMHQHSFKYLLYFFEKSNFLLKNF